MANDWNDKIIEEFRANAGIVGGMFEGFPMILLHTTGAKSGLERVTPLAYLPDETNPNRVYVFASMGGAPSHPAWYRNLKANPSVVAEVGAETFAAVAEELPLDERGAVYAEQARRFPQFAEYETKTDRVIPVIALTRK